MGITKCLILKLKHLDAISKENVDFKPILKDFISYNRWKFWKIFSFIKSIKNITNEIDMLRNIDFKKIDEYTDCRIKKPDGVDSIPFIAMIELQQLFGSDVNEKDMGDLMIDTISLACYSANRKEDFDSESESYLEFKKYVSETNLLHAVGLYKWIEREIDKSSLDWQQRFFNVEVEDKDYEAAGGSRMNQFNVLMTIKNTCIDFNIPYKEALLMPYGMTQANSLSKATQAHVQDTMSKIIESRMRQQRTANGN